MSIIQSTSAWGSQDGQTIEAILSDVSEDAVPRIEEALQILARVLNNQDGAVALDPCDPVLTDAFRCILSHRWLIPSVERMDATGKLVASFFMQPFGPGQVLSLFPSDARLSAAAAQVGAKLTPLPFTFGQVVMAHLPNMSVERMKERSAPEAYAVRALSLGEIPSMEAATDENIEAIDRVLIFSDTEFPLLQSFCHCYHLAGLVLQLQEDMVERPKEVTGAHWNEVLCTQSLHGIEVGEGGSKSIFASEDGMLLCCYPGDASKILLHHQKNGTQGLEAAKVTTLEPEKVLQLMQWQAEEKKSSLIVATAMSTQGELQLHGLKITAEMFTKKVAPGLLKKA